MSEMSRTTIRALVGKLQDSANQLQYHRVEWEVAIDGGTKEQIEHHAQGMRGQAQLCANLVKTLQPALDILGAD